MASIYKRGERWWIEYVDSHGHRVQKSLKTKDKKEANAQKTKIEYGQQSGHMILGQVPTLETYCKLYLQWRAIQFPDSQERVEQIFEQYLVPELGHWELDQIRKPQTEAYIVKRLTPDDEGEAPARSTVRKEVQSLAACINHALDGEIIQVNRMRTVRVAGVGDEKVPLSYTKAELVKLYEASPNHRWQWKFMANTGVRREEARELLLENVGEDWIKVLSLPSAPTKNKKHRIVRLNAEARAARDELKKTGDGLHLFPQITLQSMSRAFDKCAGRAGLPGSLHCLRHSYITHMLLAGVPIHVVQRLAGHSKIEMTLRYAKLIPALNMELAAEAIAL